MSICVFLPAAIILKGRPFLASFFRWGAQIERGGRSAYSGGGVIDWPSISPGCQPDCHRSFSLFGSLCCTGDRVLWLAVHYPPPLTTIIASHCTIQRIALGRPSKKVGKRCTDRRCTSRHAQVLTPTDYRRESEPNRPLCTRQNETISRKFPTAGTVASE